MFTRDVLRSTKIHEFFFVFISASRKKSRIESRTLLFIKLTVSCRFFFNEMRTLISGSFLSLFPRWFFIITDSSSGKIVCLVLMLGIRTRFTQCQKLRLSKISKRWIIFDECRKIQLLQKISGRCQKSKWALAGSCKILEIFNNSLNRDLLVIGILFKRTYKRGRGEWPNFSWIVDTWTELNNSKRGT